MLAARGTHFDPHVLDVFVAHLDEIMGLRAGSTADTPAFVAQTAA